VAALYRHEQFDAASVAVGGCDAKDAEAGIELSRDRLAQRGHGVNAERSVPADLVD
jgi:hypothetical protein